LHCSTFFHAVYKTFLTHRCLQGSAATRDRTIAWVSTNGVNFVNFFTYREDACATPPARARRLPRRAGAGQKALLNMPASGPAYIMRARWH
jgi:hypothetical protein